MGGSGRIELFERVFNRQHVATESKPECERTRAISGNPPHTNTSNEGAANYRPPGDLESTRRDYFAIPSTAHRSGDEKIEWANRMTSGGSSESNSSRKW